MAATYNDLYLDTRRLFHRAHIEGADLEARELVCLASGKTREALLRDARLYASDTTARRIEDLARRRLAGEPMAYLLGEWSFYGLTLDVSPHVLIPRTDTEVLAALAIDCLAGQKGVRVLDLCAGSGCLGLAVASRVPGCHVVLGEIDDGALDICRKNIRRNRLSGQVIPLRLDAREDPPARLGMFDCIVCNPPYIPDGDIAGLDPSVRDYEPHLALRGGEDGLDFYRLICQKWPAALKVGGRLYFEVGIGQADPVLRLMRSVGFGDIQVEPDTAGIPRVVFGTLCDEI